jgi:hypothetical protein
MEAIMSPRLAATTKNLGDNVEIRIRDNGTGIPPTGSEPFACNAMPALAGAGGYTAMDIPHNTTWEIKGQ